jgi:pyridoxal/pyridoxine/pyridoxamine kinase
MNLPELIEWAIVQTIELLFPKPSGAKLAAEKITEALTHIWGQVQQVQLGYATAPEAYARAADIVQTIKDNNKEARDAANQLPP